MQLNPGRLTSYFNSFEPLGYHTRFKKIYYTVSLLHFNFANCSHSNLLVLGISKQWMDLQAISLSGYLQYMF